MEGDAWKYGDAPELAVVRKHMAAHSHLLIMMPHYPIPVECMITEISPNGEFVLVSFGMKGWVPRAELRILDVLPATRRIQHV